AEFDTGAIKNAMILSVPEGDDKPLKYPLMFTKSDVLLINKTDIMALCDFDLAALKQRTAKLNSEIPIYEISAKTGDGIDKWMGWLRREIKNFS
ncbi:MAG: GTP-binding protein, partial [Desulfosalsimonas sp.]